MSDGGGDRRDCRRGRCHGDNRTGALDSLHLGRLGNGVGLDVFGGVEFLLHDEDRLRATNTTLGLLAGLEGDERAIRQLVIHLVAERQLTLFVFPLGIGLEQNGHREWSFGELGGFRRSANDVVTLAL